MATGIVTIGRFKVIPSSVAGNSKKPKNKNARNAIVRP